MTIYKLAVLGNPVEHSRSPEIHRLFGEQTGIELSYEKVVVPAGEFPRVAAAFMSEGHGFNITVPCKTDAWGWVDQPTDRADKAEAVNTIWRDHSGKTCGDTTDGRGLVRDITANHGWQIEGKRVLVIGAGGAVSGVLDDLVSCHPASLHLFNRTHEKALALSNRFTEVKSVKYEDLEESYDLVINGTSAGLSHEDVDLPRGIVSDNSRSYDMIYSQETTRFNQWCQSVASCETSDGLGMLVEQAAIAFTTWFDVEVETAGVIKALR